MSGMLLAVVLMGFLGWGAVLYLVIRMLFDLVMRLVRKRRPVETDEEMYERLKQYGHSDF